MTYKEKLNELAKTTFNAWDNYLKKENELSESNGFFDKKLLEDVERFYKKIEEATIEHREFYLYIQTNKINLNDEIVE